LSTRCTTSPRRFQISCSRGNIDIGTTYEYGRVTRVMLMNSPLGDGVTPAKIDGAPMFVFAPVCASMIASCAVK
jgi:hypothetical protein